MLHDNKPHGVLDRCLDAIPWPIFCWFLKIQVRHYFFVIGTSLRVINKHCRSRVKLFFLRSNDRDVRFALGPSQLLLNFLCPISMFSPMSISHGHCGRCLWFGLVWFWVGFLRGVSSRFLIGVSPPNAALFKSIIATERTVPFASSWAKVATKRLSSSSLGCVHSLHSGTSNPRELPSGRVLRNCQISTNRRILRLRPWLHESFYIRPCLLSSA